MGESRQVAADEQLSFPVEASAVGWRADRFLREHTGLPRADVRALLDAGRVRVDGRRVRKGHRLAEGTQLTVEGELPPVAARADPAVELSILFEDRWLVVVNKPPGQPSHPLRAGEMGCLANGLVARFPEMVGVGYAPREPGLVNRLDNDTSGLLLAARDGETFAHLRRMLIAGQISKRYEGICIEPVKKGEVIRRALAPAPGDGRRMTWPEASPELSEDAFRSSETLVITCKKRRIGYRVEVESARARRHQVRAHLASVGAPLAGDELYGGIALEPTGHVLHAGRMAFEHPHTRQRVDLAAPPPADWWARVDVPDNAAGASK